MREEFSPEEFLRRLDAGVFDARLSEEIRKLSTEQLTQVAVLMARRLRERGSRISELD
jgi:hypothetical protein